VPLARIGSATVAFAATLVVLWVGLPLLAPIYLALTAVAIQEYAAMLALRGVPVRRRSLWVVTALTLPASLPVGHPWMAEWGHLPWRELLLIGFGLYLLVAEIVTSNQRSLHALVFTLFGYVWISWGFGLILTLRYTPDGVVGMWYLTLPMLAIIATDVGGYIFGSLFGRRPLAPRISPKKTVEGMWGGVGLAFAIVAGTIFAATRWGGVEFGLVHVAIFGLAIPFAALAGDLFESLVKRWAGVKDTGVFLPGQGGVLDRIDSALIAIPASYLLLTLAFGP
jgi:phosphatidate cytidylyltransferase